MLIMPLHLGPSLFPPGTSRVTDMICWHNWLFKQYLLRGSSKNICGVPVCTCIDAQMRLKGDPARVRMQTMSFLLESVLFFLYGEIFLDLPVPLFLTTVAWGIHKYLRDQRESCDKEFSLPKNYWKILLGKRKTHRVPLPSLWSIFFIIAFFPVRHHFSLCLFSYIYLYFFLSFTSDILSNLWHFR